MKKKILQHIVRTASLWGGLVAATAMTSCSGYLDVYPEDTMPADKYWTSKDEVESVLYAGYYTLRNSVESYLIPWGEYRAGCVYRLKGDDLQQFNITTGNKTCSWATMYQIIHDANLVLEKAATAKENDDSYRVQEMNSHLCEAYWLRAMSYFYLVRNWRDVPLVTASYETDRDDYNIPKSQESDVIALIKSDVNTALSMGAAKENFDKTWQTKGRATKWALLCLKADVALWNHDYDEAIAAADSVLQSKSATAPRFMATATHSGWFSMFNPGNANESVFELQWSRNLNDGTMVQNNNLPSMFGGLNDSNGNTTVRTLQYSDAMTEAFASEYQEAMQHYFDDNLCVRSQYGSCGNIDVNSNMVWKYVGGTTLREMRTNDELDPNYILYRIPDLMLAKAEALVMRNQGQSLEDNRAALALVNTIRKRANLQSSTADETSLEAVMDAIYNERIMEFAAEGKAWYDFLRLGRYGTVGGVDFKRKMVDNVVTYNHQASESTIRNTLGNVDKWYLPIYDGEISVNSQLVQNPGY